jgi:RNA polymerase sigma-70 factor (ECF subfamily)
MDGVTAALFAAGSAAWPSIAVDSVAFAARAEAQSRAGASVPLEHAADFYLACACAEGSAAAIRALDGILRSETVRSISRIDSSSAFVDEALQTVRVKLIAGDAPKIAEYVGRSPLRRWLVTVAVRTALNLRRGKENEPRETLESTIGVAVAGGPELALAREKYRAAFEEGLRVSIATLTDHERTLLRMNLVEQIGIDRLARIYGCGRSTAARRLSAARDKLLDGIRTHLRSTLGLTAAEVESLAAVVRSELDVSIARLLDPDAS